MTNQTTTYLATDSEGDVINEDSTIVPFTADSHEAALDKMLAYAADLYQLDEGESLEIEEGQFSDCWSKWNQENEVDDFYAQEPFTADQLIIRRAGTHPGGWGVWTSPRETIYVIIVKRDDT